MLPSCLTTTYRLPLCAHARHCDVHYTVPYVKKGNAAYPVSTRLRLVFLRAIDLRAERESICECVSPCFLICLRLLIMFSPNLFHSQDARFRSHFKLRVRQAGRSQQIHLRLKYRNDDIFSEEKLISSLRQVCNIVEIR